jgi:hypothetical protein
MTVKRSATRWMKRRVAIDTMQRNQHVDGAACGSNPFARSDDLM